MPIPTNEAKCDVLIIGAGPAGVMCANGLSRLGVNVRIIDKRPRKVAAGQADGIQPRTIEVLQSYGLADRLLREANRMYMAAFYNPGRDGGIERTSRAPDVTAPTARYPFEATLHQGAIENIFLDSMRTRGFEVERPIRPTSIELSTDKVTLSDPNAHAVKVVLQHYSEDAATETKTETVHAKFVLGADGAHSWVRRNMGIEMEGERTEYIWGVMDIIPDTDFPDIRNRCAIHSLNGSCMIVPREGDKVRLYIQLESTPELLTADGQIDRNAITPDRLMGVAQKSFHPYFIKPVGEPDWWSIYQIRQQVANQFSVNERIFIAGDACHTHSPKAGQGMNASMNDSHNLIWKLTYVLRGWADMSLLKTYEEERRKYAQDLISFDKKFAALFSGKAKSATQDGVSHEDFLETFQTFGGFTSGIGIHYQPSMIVDPAGQSCVSKLTIGQRVIPTTLIRAADAYPLELQDLLPADGRFRLLIFAGDTTDAAQLARVRSLAEQLDKPDSFLRRCDGGDMHKVFDILSICSGKLMAVNYTDIPLLFRSHWSKVLIDDRDITGKIGGTTYESYGVSPAGATVVVRPDGYVAAAASLEDTREVLQAYFTKAGLVRKA